MRFHGRLRPSSVKAAPVESGSRITMVSPPPGCLFRGECAAHRFGEALGHGQAESDPGGRGNVVEPLERLEHPARRFRRGRPGRGR